MFDQDHSYMDPGKKKSTNQANKQQTAKKSDVKYTGKQV